MAAATEYVSVHSAARSDVVLFNPAIDRFRREQTFALGRVDKVWQTNVWAELNVDCLWE